MKNIRISNKRNKVIKYEKFRKRLKKLYKMRKLCNSPLISYLEGNIGIIQIMQQKNIHYYYYTYNILKHI